jgi:hypothetical protein
LLEVAGNRQVTRFLKVASLDLGKRQAATGSAPSFLVDVGRRTLVAPDRVRIFLGRVVVIPRHDLSIDRDGMGMSVALVEVGICQRLAALAQIAVQAETVRDITHQRRMGTRGVRLRQATRQAVIVVGAAHLRMPFATVLHFMRRRIAAIGVERIEQAGTGQKNADRAKAGAARLRGNRRIGRQSPCDGDTADAVRILVVLIRRILRTDREGAGDVTRQPIADDVEEAIEQRR